MAWVERYGAPTVNSAAEGVAVSPGSSQVFVTGNSGNGTATVACNS